jgi:putative ABC transport system substrate-binding protein
MIAYRNGARWTRLCALAGSLIAASIAADAQQSAVARLGILAPTRCSHPNFQALRDGLSELGYVEGQTIIIECREMGGSSKEVSQAAAELVRLKVDVLVTDGTRAALAAKQATKALPIVMATVGDPVGSGLVTSLARPGANITGLALMTAEMNVKRVELLKTVDPRIRQVAVLSNPLNPASAPGISGTDAAARSFGMTTHGVGAKRVEDLEGAFSAILKEQASALIVLPDPILFTHRAKIVALAAKNRLSAIYEAREFAEDGGLMAYGPRITANFRRAATYVDKILKGAKPGDLPIEQPTTFELVINLKTAKALGLTIPPSLLARADQIID